MSFVNKRHWNNSTTNSRLKSSSSKAPRRKRNRRTNPEDGRHRAMGPARIWDGPDHLSCAKMAPTKKLIILASGQGFSTTKFKGRSRSSSTSEPLDELVWRWIQDAKLQIHNGPTLAATKVSDSPLRRHLGVWVPEEVLNSTLCYYSGANNPVQHIRHFRNKMWSIPATICSCA